MATLSNILAWEIPWMEEPGRYSLWGRRVRLTEGLSTTAQPVLCCFSLLVCIQVGMHP